MDNMMSSLSLPPVMGASKRDLGSSVGVYNPLMSSLALPRKAVKGSGGRESTVVRAADGSSIPTSKLTLLRLDDHDEIRRAQAAEADEVKALAPVVTETGVSSTRLEGVHKMQETRRSRHDDAIRKFEEHQRRYYADCENRVLRLGRDLRSALLSVDSRIDAMLAEVNDPKASVLEDKAWLEAHKAALESLENERRQRVEIFAAGLEGVELDRSHVMGERLQALCAVLVDIGFELTPDVHRLVNAVSAELNAVVLDNKKEHADVVAKLEMSCVMARSNSNARWALAEAAWRRLKHDCIVADFQQFLNAPSTINPKARVQSLASIGDSRLARNSSIRLPLVRELASLRPPALTEDAIQDIRRKLDAVDSEDAEDVQSRLAQVKSLQAEHITWLQQQLENLRQSLHSFEALHPSGKLPEHAALVKRLVNDPANEEILRRSNSLRMEIEGIAAAAGAADTIYSLPLQSLSGRVELVVHAMEIGSVLDSIGKSAERSALLSLVDSLKMAKKSDMPVILVKLHKLVSSMQRVPGIPSAVLAELGAVADILDEAIDDIHEGMVSAGLEVPLPMLKFLFPDKYGAGLGTASGDDAASVAGSRQSRHTAAKSAGRTPGKASKESARPPSASKRGTAAGVAHSEAGSRSSGQSKRTRRSVANRTSAGSVMTDTLSQVLGAVLPLPAIRAAQKRLGVIAAASDLPSGFRDAMMAMLTGCQKQSVANAGVDEAIQSHCHPIMLQRQAEGSAMLMRIVASYDNQLRKSKDSTDRLCSFFVELAKSVHVHATDQARTDEWTTEELAEQQQSFQDSLTDLEHQLSQATQDVERAATFPDLARKFEGALQVLDNIQRNYRQHSSVSCQWASLHGPRVSYTLRRHRAALCRIFAISFLDAAMVDGTPLDGEEDSVISWSVNGPQKSRPRSESTTDDGVPPGSSVASLVRICDPSNIPFEIPAGLLDYSGSTADGGFINGAVHYMDLVGMDKIAAFFCDPTRTLDSIKAVQVHSHALKRQAEIEDALPRLQERVMEAKALSEQKASAAAGKKVKKGKEDLDQKAAEEAANAYASLCAELAALQDENRKVHAVLLGRKPSTAEHDSAVFKMGLYDEAGFPLDPDGGTCLEDVGVSSVELTSILSELRTSILAQFEQYGTERRSLTERLKDARIASLTVELEEQLRNHWPRRGELEVNVRAPRSQQLVEHKEKLDRFLRKIAEMASAGSNGFQQLLRGQKSDALGFSNLIVSFKADLSSISTMAGVQGMQGRVRKAQAEFSQFLPLSKTRLTSLATTELHRLQVMCEDWVKQCKSFDIGGNYDQAEILESATQVEAVIANLVKSHAAQVELIEEFAKSASVTAEQFEDLLREVDKVSHTLALRDGLGSKYGEPRRVAQETLRTAAAWSEEAAALIDSRLMELEQLIQCSVGEKPNIAGGVLSKLNDDELAIVRNSRPDKQLLDADAPTASTDKDKSKPTVKGATATATKGAKAPPGAKKLDAAAVETPAAPEETAFAQATAAAEALAVDQADLTRRGLAPLSVRIRHCVTVLRDLCYGRALDLQALKAQPDMFGPLRTFILPFISLSDVAPAEALKLPFDLEDGTDIAIPEDGGLVLTLKGKGSTASKVAADAKLPYHDVASKCLEKCKASTVALFAQEGVTVKSDAELPDSLREFIQRETIKAAELREYAMRRYRDQVSRCQQLLEQAGSVVAADVTARSTRQASMAHDELLQGVKIQQKASDEVRMSHVEALRMQLADPNALISLRALHNAEHQRMQQALQFLQDTERVEQQRHETSAQLAARMLATNTALFLLVAEECVRTEDLAPLPGDELRLPSKPSFKRLHKAMRKSTAGSAGVLAAAALGDVDGIVLDETGEVVTAPAEGADLSKSAPRDKQPIKPAKDSKVPVATSTAIKGKQEVSPVHVPEEPVTARALKPAFERRLWGGCNLPAAKLDVLAPVHTLYSACSRHAIHARDGAASELQHALDTSHAEVVDQLHASIESINTWSQIWRNKVRLLNPAAVEETLEMRAPAATPGVASVVVPAGVTKATKSGTKAK